MQPASVLLAAGEDVKELAANHNLLDFLTNLAYITAFSKLHHKKTAIFTLVDNTAVCHTLSDRYFAGPAYLPIVAAPRAQVKTDPISHL